MAVALGDGDATLDLLAVTPAIGEAGHLVVVGHENETLLELLALADVLDLGDEVERLPSESRTRATFSSAQTIAHRGGNTLLHLVCADVARDDLSDVLEVEIEILGVSDLLEGLDPEL